MRALKDLLPHWQSLQCASFHIMKRSFAVLAAAEPLPFSPPSPSQPSTLLPPHQSLATLTDLRYPSSWYPLARSLNRKIIAHLGPTNSGKTHNALIALTTANSGLYCGPLRLLAWEVASRLNEQSVLCNLITGQEIKEIPGAQHTASTVEMASTTTKCDVAIIDELQLLSDSSRGWAFTRAFLGIPAEELHVCGDPAMLPLLERLCSETREHLTVYTYQRLSPLVVAHQPLWSLENVRHGDCVVSFSRKEVHAVRKKIEKGGDHRCAVVYGALPPESRSMQATLFNTHGNGVGVLSASDAIGMGLNLAIKRIVFTTLTKYDGLQDRALAATEIKQIAGRAGRFSSGFSEGVVTVTNKEDLPLLKEALNSPVEPIKAAAVFPRFEQLAAFSAAAFPDLELADLLDTFAAAATLEDDTYFYAEFQEVKANAVMLQHLNLSLRDTYTFSISPCDPSDTPVAEALVTFATAFSLGHTVTPELISHPPLTLAQSSQELRQLEATHRTFDLFVWLSYRFEEEFEGRERAEQVRTLTAMYVDESIQRMSSVPMVRTARKDAAKRLKNIKAVKRGILVDSELRQVLDGRI